MKKIILLLLITQGVMGQSIFTTGNPKTILLRKQTTLSIPNLGLLLGNEGGTLRYIDSLGSKKTISTDTDLLGKENSLGNPASNGHILSSTTGGTRSWIAPPTGATWGAITGTLSSQSDLNDVLNLKANLSGATFTGDIISNSKLLFGVTSGNATRIEISSNSTSYAQSSAQISVRATSVGSNQNNIEWGHQGSGRSSNFGAEANSGDPVIVLNGELGTTANLYTTRGYAGSVIKGHSIGGHLSFSRLTGIASVNQSLTESMRITGTGNVLINSTTDAGERLQVTGTSRFVGAMSITADVNATTFNPTGMSGYGFCKNGSNYLISGIGGVFFQDWSNATQYFFSSNAGTQIKPAGDARTLTASAALEIVSTTKGFLPPRMTLAQRTAIASPAIGLHVYQTDGTEGVWVFKSTGWVFAY